MFVHFSSSVRPFIFQAARLIYSRFITGCSIFIHPVFCFSFLFCVKCFELKKKRPTCANLQLKTTTSAFLSNIFFYIGTLYNLCNNLFVLPQYSGRIGRETSPETAPAIHFLTRACRTKFWQVQCNMKRGKQKKKKRTNRPLFRLFSFGTWRRIVLFYVYLILASKICSASILIIYL